VQFREAAPFASKAEINVFCNFFEWSGPEDACGVKKFFFEKNVVFSL
jgi:hypothetical protein